MKETDSEGKPREVWAKRFKQARLAASLSQKQLGTAAGLDEFIASSRINRYERGIHKADFPMAVKLSRVLGIPVAFLYCEDDELAGVLLSFHHASRATRRAIVDLLAAGDSKK